jgi:hypothetical protein
MLNTIIISLALFCFCIVDACLSPPDVYESNQSIQNATIVTSGQVIEANLCPAAGAPPSPQEFDYYSLLIDKLQPVGYIQVDLTWRETIFNLPTGNNKVQLSFYEDGMFCVFS